MEVVKLAVHALLARGGAVRKQALSLAQQPEHELYRAGLAYLEGLLGLPVVWVPPGPFWMGSDDAMDPQALLYESPKHQVTLRDTGSGVFQSQSASFGPSRTPTGGIQKVYLRRVITRACG